MTKNMGAAIALLLFSLSLIFYITPNYVEHPGLTGISPRYFPNFAAIVLALSSVSLLVLEIISVLKEKRSLRSKINSDHLATTAKKTPLTPLLIGGLLLLYILLFKYLGFLISTPLILAALMISMGQRRVVLIVASSLVSTFLLFQLFQNILGLPLQ